MKQKPRKWQLWEHDFMRNNYGKIPIKKIAERLGRTEDSIKSKAVVLELQSPVRGRPPKGKTECKEKCRVITAAKKERKTYKTVLPEEKWAAMEHFLASFCRYGIKSKRLGKTLDVGKFMTEYVKAYAGKEAKML